MLAFARKVIVVPGYGMAVAQAQHDVRQLADSSSSAAWRSGTRSTRLPDACRAT